jgi:DNA-binding CsgD family transcriptional regulator
MKSTAVSAHATSLRQHASDTPVTDTSVRIGSAAMPRERRKVIPPHLTPRQLEVLSLLCEGLPNKLICRRLNIATGTVKVHISCILRELGVTSRLQAVVAARRCGLLEEFAVSTPQRAAGPTTAAQSTTAAPCRAYGTFHLPAAVIGKYEAHETTLCSMPHL